MTRMWRTALACAVPAMALSATLLTSISAQTPKVEAPIVKLAPPHVADIPDDAKGKEIALGRRLLAETNTLMPENVGAQMSCNSCHLGDGRVANASPYYGMSVDYPRFNARAGRAVTLVERINGCLLRSMNGKPVPPDSPQMKAMVAYLDWLSADLPAHAKVEGAGIGKVDTSLVPDPARGKELYEAKCGECHGTDGAGRKDAQGAFVIPPLWGDQSFNIGAGMARTYTAAAFIKSNMPMAFGLNAPLGQGSALTDQEAVNIAEYFTHQPRPDFVPKVNDWPNGGRPKDARY